jgi:hypothetical protein
MVPDRLHLAQLAYLRAVAVARASSTRATWMRLLTAAKNLTSARRDRGRRRPEAAAWDALARARAVPAAPGASAAEARVLALPLPPPPAPAPAVPALPLPALAAPAARHRPPLSWPELDEDVRMARRLVAEARALQEQSRALRAANREALAQMRAARASWYRAPACP